MAIEFFSKTGIETVSKSEVKDELDNYGQGELDPSAVFDLGLAADHSDADALVLSCTDMRSVEIIERLEQAIGKPVISSNQAMMFQALQHAGIEDTVPGYGNILNRDRL